MPLLPSASDGVRDLRGGSGDEWLGQPHTPCTKSDPTWGAGGWRWGGEVGGENGRPLPRRVDGALWRRQSQGGRDADGRTTPRVERSGSRDTGAKFEATVSPVRFACQISLERIWNNRVNSEFLLAFCNQSLEIHCTGFFQNRANWTLRVTSDERQGYLYPSCHLCERASSLFLPVPPVHFGA